MRGHLDDMLDWGEMEDGGRPLRKVRVNSHRLLQGLLHLSRRASPRKWVTANPNRIARALQYLLAELLMGSVY